MSKCHFHDQFVVKIRFSMSKYDIRYHYACQNKILNVEIRFSAQYECQNRILKVKVLYQHQFKCINMILNVKIRFSALDRMSK